MDHGDRAGRIGGGGHGPRLPDGCLARRAAPDAEHQRRLAKEPADHVVIMDRMDHHLQPGCLEHPWPGMPVRPDVDRDRHRGDVADPAQLDHPVGRGHPLVEAKLLVHDQDQPARLGEVHHRLSGGRIRCERLLGQHVAPRFERPAHDLGLGGRGHGDVHHLDPIVAEQVLERLVDPRHAVTAGDVDRSRGMVVVDPGDLETGGPIGGQVREVHDGAGSDDGDRPSMGVGDLDPAGLGDRIELRDHAPPPGSRSAGIP